MARQDPVRGMKEAVDEHFDAAVGTHVRTVVGAAEHVGRPVREAVEGGYRKLRRWWDGPPKRTTDIRLPSEPTRRKAGRRTTRSR